MGRYDAFISYSHAKDKPVAAALQSVIQRLGKPWYRRRALRLFRDDTSLSATPHLWPTIEIALNESRFLVLLASSQAAASPWVEKEVAWWLANKSSDTLLIAVTDGELGWDNSRNDFVWHEGMPLPAILAGRFSTEPKWVDLRAYRDSAEQTDAHFTNLAADFAAAIHGVPKEDLLSEEVRQQRRSLTHAWSAAGTLALLIMLAGWQWWEAETAKKIATEQKQFAEAQRDRAVAAEDVAVNQRRIADEQAGIARTEAARADRNFTAAKSTLEAVIFELVQGLKDVEGMRADTVQRILGKAEEAVEQLATETDDDLQVRRSQGAMFGLFAEIYLRLGETQLANDYIRKALELFDQVAKKHPGDASWKHDLTVTLIHAGDVLMADRNFPAALSAYRKSLEIRRDLALSDRGNQEWQRELSANLSRVGDVLEAQGDVDGALAANREAVEIMRKLVRLSDKPEWRHDLAVSLGKLGDAQYNKSGPGIALATYRESLGIRRELAELDPGNTEWQTELGSLLISMGDAFRAFGQSREALAAYRESLDVDRALATKDPSNTKFLRDKSVSLDKIGDALLDQGNSEGAFASLRESVDIRRSLMAKDPDNRERRRDLRVGLNKLGDSLKAQGNVPGAIQTYRESLTIARWLAEKHPDDAEWPIGIVITLRRLAAVKDNARGRLSEARQILRQLNDQNLLTDLQRSWLDSIESELSSASRRNTR